MLAARIMECGLVLTSVLHYEWRRAANVVCNKRSFLGCSLGGQIARVWLTLQSRIMFSSESFHYADSVTHKSRRHSFNDVLR